MRYGKTTTSEQQHSELAFLRLRYKAPDSDTSKLLERALKRQDIANNTSERFRFSAAVAAFGQQLRGGTYLDKFSYDDILSLARGARGNDPFGYRSEFLKLVKLSQSLSQSMKDNF
jgi:Ca-activated chloride channel family protein